MHSAKAAAATGDGGLRSWRSITLLPPPPPLHSWALNLSSTPPPGPLIPLSLTNSSAVCMCVHMRAGLRARVSHRSPPRGRLPSAGDAWVPPVNFTAFIWPDEWLAALSAPSACNLKWFPGAARRLQLWSRSPA